MSGMVFALVGLPTIALGVFVWWYRNERSKVEAERSGPQPGVIYVNFTDHRGRCGQRSRPVSSPPGGWGVGAARIGDDEPPRAA